MNTIKQEALSILKILSQIKEDNEKQEENSKKNVIFNKKIMSQYIIPCLHVKDIVNLRSTSKEVNNLINSPLIIISYIKHIDKKKENHINTRPNSQFELKPFSELYDIEDLQAQIHSLKGVNEYLAKKIKSSESFIKACQSDIDYLKKQLESQQQLTVTLSENLNFTRGELEKYKQENSDLTISSHEANKKYQDSTVSLKLENEALRFKNDKLLYEIETLQRGVYKITRQKEEIERKNEEKGRVLKSIRNYFTGSGLFRIKNICDIEREYEEKRRLNG